MVLFSAHKQTLTLLKNVPTLPDNSRKCKRFGLFAIRPQAIAAHKIPHLRVQSGFILFYRAPMIKPLNTRQRQQIRNLNAAALVNHLANHHTGFADMLAALVYWFRCGGADDAEMRIIALQNALRLNPSQCALIGGVLHHWLRQVHLYPGFVSVGLFSRQGFMREMGTRLYDRFNPPPQSAQDLRDVLKQAFDGRRDPAWLNRIAPAQWEVLYRILSEHTGADAVRSSAAHFEHESLHAMEMLSIWVAAEELDGDLIRIDKRLLEIDSPFVALQREMTQLTHHAHARLGDADLAPYDDSHARVMIDQCRQQIARLKRRGTGAGAGSSMAVAHLLERLTQTVNRLEALLNIQTAATSAERSHHILRLAGHLIQAGASHQSIGSLWRSSVRMLSQSITQNTSDHGEHYITRNRREYWGMLRSAAGAGVIIALMALLKIRIGELGFGQGFTTLLVCLNYGLGFVLVHILHFTIATKQPAMTAASVAAEVQRNDKGRAQSARLAGLLLDVNRSQSIAVVGNVSVAIVVAMALSLAMFYWQGQPLLSTETSAYLVHANQPLAGLALYYAAIAAVWLFCSGIIAGFFDNRADYLQLAQRIQDHPWLSKIMRPATRKRLGEYLHQNYGSLMGNFLFGVLLGLTGYIGHLTGLPLDIRHVAFASANLGYAAASSGMGIGLFLLNLLFVLMIGVVNLWVSFALALVVALRAREARLGNIGTLLSAVAAEIKARPLSLVFPPKNEVEVTATAEEEILK